MNWAGSAREISPALRLRRPFGLVCNSLARALPFIDPVPLHRVLIWPFGEHPAPKHDRPVRVDNVSVEVVPVRYIDGEGQERRRGVEARRGKDGRVADPEVGEGDVGELGCDQERKRASQ